MAFGDTIQSAQASAASGNITPTLGAGATAGNLLIAGFSAANNATWGAITGWTQITIIDAASPNLDAVWYYKIAAGGETTVTSNRTAGTGAIRGIIAEFEGPFDATPLDQSTDDETNVATVVTSQASGTTGTTTRPDELALAFFAADAATNIDTSRSLNNSFTEVIFADVTDSPGRPAVVLAKRVLTATGTYSTTYSCTDTGDEMYGAIATFEKQSTNNVPTVALNTADGSIINDSTPTLLFTGSDTESDDITYKIQISDNPAFATGTNTIDSYTDTTSQAQIHPNPSGAGNTWEGNQQVDDRPGQSFTAKGGILDKIRMYMLRDEADTDGTAYVRVYAHQGTFGTSSEPLNAADPADTPTGNWLAKSDGVVLNGTMSSSAAWYDFTFSGANRIKLSDAVKYVLVLDWVPNGTSEPLTNTINVIGSLNLGHNGNAYNDGRELNNNGVNSGWDILFQLLEVQLLLDKISSTDAGFVNQVNGADTSPFTAGDQIGYTVQAGDALADGVYWWRVQPSDAGGTGSWSAARSFTIDTNTAASIQPTGIASAGAFGTATIQPGAVSVSPGAIASAEVFGTTQINQNVAPSGLATSEAFGNPSITVGAVSVSPSGIASGEAFGNATVQPGSVSVAPTGIPSAEAFGTAQLNLVISPTGITSAEAFGTTNLNLNVNPSGIASAEAFGTSAVSLGGGTQNVSPSGITSAEAFGTVNIQPGAVSASPTGISSGEAFGVTQLYLSITPAGIVSQEAFGTTAIQPGVVAISPSSISSAEAFGNATVSQGAGPQNISPSGIGSAEAFGTTKLNLNVQPSGIASAEAFGIAQLSHVIVVGGIASAEVFGTPDISGGTTTIAPQGIVSSEAFGSAVLTVGAVSVSPSSIGSAEAFGTTQLNLSVVPTAITTDEIFGTPTVTSGAVSINPSSVASSEAFGTPVLTTGAVSVEPAGIVSAEAFGTPAIDLVAYSIRPTGIGSTEAFGTATLVPGAVTITAAGVASREAFGTLSIANAIELQPLRLDVYIAEALLKDVYVAEELKADVYIR